MSDSIELFVQGMSSEQLEETVKNNTERLASGEEDNRGIIDTTLFLSKMELKKRDGGKRYRDKEGNLRNKTWGTVVGCSGHLHGSIIPSDPNKCDYFACGMCNKCGKYITHKDTHGPQNRDYIEDEILEGMGII